MTETQTATLDKPKQQPIRYVQTLDLQAVPAQLYLRQWRDFAACKEIPTDAITTDQVKEQKWLSGICIACPVRKMCLFDGLKNELPGVWGGTTDEEREKLGNNRSFMRNLKQEVEENQIDQQATIARTPQRLRQFVQATFVSREAAQVIYNRGPQPEDVQRPPIEDPDRPRVGETLVGWYTRLIQEISHDLRESVPNIVAAKRYFKRSEVTIKQALKDADLTEQVAYYLHMRAKRRRLDTAIEAALAVCEQDGTPFPQIKDFAQQVGYYPKFVGEIIKEKCEDPIFEQRFMAAAAYYRKLKEKGKK